MSLIAFFRSQALISDQLSLYYSIQMPILSACFYQCYPIILFHFLGSFAVSVLKILISMNESSVINGCFTNFGSKSVTS